MPDQSKTISGLYLISDRCLTCDRTHEDIVAGGIEGGASVVQLREKRLSVRELYEVALKVREMTRDAGVLFIVNDSVELALAVGADGVHLGQQDMPIATARKMLGSSMIIGISTHSMEEAMAAVADGADYIGFGPIFPTGTKDAGEPKGPDAIRLIRAAVDIPIAAIGGINAGNAMLAIEAGADAVAVISAVSGADDVKKAAEDISSLFATR